MTCSSPTNGSRIAYTYLWANYNGGKTMLFEQYNSSEGTIVDNYVCNTNTATLA